MDRGPMAHNRSSEGAPRSQEASARFKHAPHRDLGGAWRHHGGNRAPEIPQAVGCTRCEYGRCNQLWPRARAGAGCRPPAEPVYRGLYDLWHAKRRLSNVVLVCHALTGDQFAASQHPVTGRPGWWETMVGPGRPIYTDRFFVICLNVIGGCMGSTVPAESDPATGKPFGLDFPLVTVRDMVRAQAMLLDALGISEILCVVGGSMGGMQVLQWAASYPERIISAIPIATAARHSAQNIAFHEVGRQAIMADPDWRGGDSEKVWPFPAES